MKQIHFTLLLLTLLLSSCSPHKETLRDATLKEDAHIYYFYNVVEGEADVLKAEHLSHLDNRKVGVVIDSLLNRLSARYSGQYSSLPQSNVKFEILKMKVIDTGTKDYRIAVININDPGNIMVRGYFQGSAGGKNTQDNIFLTLMQPQIEGFIDGLIIHLNNKPVSLMDHVNFEGIKSPVGLKHYAERAIR